MTEIIRILVISILCAGLASCQISEAEREDFERRALSHLSQKYDQNFTIIKSEWDHESRLWEASVRSPEHPHLRITVSEYRDKSLRDDYLPLLWLEQAKPVLNPLIQDTFPSGDYAITFSWIPTDAFAAAGPAWKRNQYPTYHEPAKKGQVRLSLAIFIHRLVEKKDLAQKAFTLRQKLMAAGIMKTALYLSYGGEITENRGDFFQRRSLDLPLEKMDSVESIIQAMRE